MSCKIINKTNGQCISSDAKVAKTFIERLVGLLNRKSLPPEEALIFYNVSSIHMFFMRFPIDVVFLDSNMQVIRICQNLKPWRLASCLKAAITIELPNGRAENTHLALGDILEFVS